MPNPITANPRAQALAAAAALPPSDDPTSEDIVVVIFVVTTALIAMISVFVPSGLDVLRLLLPLDTFLLGRYFALHTGSQSGAC